ALQVVAATLLLMAFLLWADESLQWISASRMQRVVQFVLVCLGAAVVYFGALWAGGFKLLEQIRR
ncbi:MAG: lipid II flippase MurJ, partial [Brachymonas sp.]|nr:lipid II flippase MurJ [Brachymonas sp.]